MFEDRSSINADFSNSYTGLNLTNIPGSSELSDIITPNGSSNLPVTGAVSSANLFAVSLSTITISATDSAASETLMGGTPNTGSFTLTRTNDITNSLAVNYTIGGTATNGQDYDSLTGVAIFSAGSSTAIININPIDDTLFEGKETVQLNLKSDSTYLLGKAKGATVNINDNDKPTISIVANDSTALETTVGTPTNPGQFTLTRTGNTAAALTVKYLMSGTAVSGQDYDSLTGSVTFAAGSSTAIINLNPINDGVYEGTETVTLTLKSGSAYALAPSSAASVSIDDPATIIVTSPNGGEVLGVNSSYNITWNDNIGDNVKIELYKGGSFYSTVSASTVSDGSENWTVSSAIADGTDYTFKITSLVDSNLFDFSNGDFTISSTTDWFSQNLKDTGLANLTRTLANDGQLNRNDVISILRDAEDSNVIDTYEFTDLKTILSNAAKFTIQDYVVDLFDKVVNGDLANTKYQGANLGNLTVGSSNTQMENLIGKWFLGTDRPFSTYGYQYFSQPLYANGINPDDVRQGQVGDCYFLATLAAIANEQPNYIQNMFIDNGDNTFTVRFFKNGVAEYVTVDRFLPKASWGAAYANASTEMWVALAEKAYAQLAESQWSRSITSTNAYDSISGGWMSDAIPQVTAINAVSKYITSTTKAQLISLSNSNTLLTVGFVYGTIAADGIVNGHAYTITGYDAATDKFFLRNPWGYSHASVTWDQLIANKAIFNWSV
jgi:Calpain family cysteine protease/Calx-beta domain/Ser-Thr-rich glycosyl-phosphatidyl-inositol-anchored membrane family